MLRARHDMMANGVRKSVRVLGLLLALGWAMGAGILNSAQGATWPMVKEWKAGQGKMLFKTVEITANSDKLENETEILQTLLYSNAIRMREDGFPIRLELATLEFPEIRSAYKQRIEDEGYRLVADDKGITIQGRSPAAVFYGIQTLGELLGDKDGIPRGEIRDWPDLAVRMIMVDPARQNENMDYYRRLIRFCARYKVNAILIHLTDDQTSCLYQEDYPALMHPQAWKPEEIRRLVVYAKRHHIELIPEIESFGHSRMFVRDPRYREILHQTKSAVASQSWMGTDMPGYTNVLCPASDETYKYLDKMYARAAETFPSEYLHIGCDEVDMAQCERCEKKSPGISQSDWFLGHLLRCRELALKQGKKVALWGDMLLADPKVADGLPTTNTVIYDWHYTPDVSDKSVKFFKERGFEVIGCPALVCAPHMIMPDEHDYTNIARFATIARENDLMGLNTTIWLPERYMSDVLWPGIAFAAVHSWAGSGWDEQTFYAGFVRDNFGSNQGASFGKTWVELSMIIWHRTEFNTSCWMDDESLSQACKLADERTTEVKSNLEKIQAIRAELARIGATICKNREEWDALEQSAAILAYTQEHLLASSKVQENGKWNRTVVEELQKGCERAIQWIEKDWDRNRYPDDPNKNGIYLANQHLLFRFKEMHEYHQRILGGIEKGD